MTTHAYLWIGAEFDGLAVADGVKHHYLSTATKPDQC